MKAEEMKALALEVARKQYDDVIQALKAEAQKGNLSCKFSDLRDGTCKLLEIDGYGVEQLRDPRSNVLTNSYRIFIKD